MSPVSEPRVSQAVSAGGVVYRRSGTSLEVVLCGRNRSGLWALPKGTPDDGESREQTALREVREETGLQVAIEQPLGDIEYWFTRPGERIHKRVYFYLMAEQGGSFEEHDPEFDVVRWAPAPEALALLTYPTEAEVLRRAAQALGVELGA
jgi:8-oxo-dGTP pyrophosphatase MutT (NUDIX family)